MRKALITALALGASLTLPAAAFADHNNSRGQYRCKSDSDDQVVGALIGGVLGGLLGSEIAGRGDRTEGAVAGAVLGGVLGAVVTDGEDCNRGRKVKNGKRRYKNTRGYGNNNGYNNGYNNAGYGYNNGNGYNDPYANQNRRYRKNERRARRNARRNEQRYNQRNNQRNSQRYGQRNNQRSGFWNEQLEGGYQQGATYNTGYYNTGAYQREKCRYRDVTTNYSNGRQRTKQVKECRGVNGNWIRR